jgi:hypothetical protein
MAVLLGKEFSNDASMGNALIDRAELFNTIYFGSNTILQKVAYFEGALHMSPRKLYKYDKQRRVYIYALRGHKFFGEGPLAERIL